MEKEIVKKVPNRIGGDFVRNGTGYKKKGKKEYRKEATYKYALLKAKSLTHE